VNGQHEKMSLETCSKLAATDGRGAKVKRQWVTDNLRCDEEALYRYVTTVNTTLQFIAALAAEITKWAQIKWHHFTFERYWTPLFL